VKDLNFTKNGGKRVRVICKKESCQLQGYCAKIPGEKTWQLMKIVDDHNCPWEYKV